MMHGCGGFLHRKEGIKEDVKHTLVLFCLGYYMYMKLRALRSIVLVGGV